jgi:hypothetical protein
VDPDKPIPFAPKRVFNSGLPRGLVLFAGGEGLGGFDYDHPAASESYALQPASLDQTIDSSNVDVEFRRRRLSALQLRLYGGLSPFMHQSLGSPLRRSYSYDAHREL